jgi:PAS domain S-box-containing protein
MRHQPCQSTPNREIQTFAEPANRWQGTWGFALPALLALPLQGHAIAAIDIAPESAFTAILAGLAGILGLSASLLYRQMHQREEELRRRADNAEAELRALLMMTDEAVLLLSPDGTIRAANPAAEEIFDCTAEEFIGDVLTKVIAQPLALGELTKHGPVNFETTARRGEGGFSQVEMLLSPVELGGGRSYLAIIHDVRAEFPGDPLKRSTRKPELQTAMSKFTHDLNNQLTSVLGNLSLILMARPGDPGTHERVLNAKKTAVRAQALSQKLQSLANPGENDEMPVPEATGVSCTILPMPNMQAPAKVEPSRAAGPSRILILDDEDAICLLVASALDASGFEVTPATSAAAAIRACEEATHSGQPFSLVICDLSLPGDMNGIQAFQKLRAIDPDIKAIVSSGYDGDPVMRDCRKHGFSAAMAKPYEISKLVRTVGEVLSGGTASIRKSA